MKKIISSTTILCGLLVSGTGMAVPHVFNQGEPARASEVNDNFDSLEKRALPRFDFHDFGQAANIVSKTYTTSEPGCGNTETRLYSRTVNGDNTEIRMTRQRFDVELVICQTRIFNYLATPDSFSILSQERWNNPGTVYKSVETLASPAIRRTSNMLQGTTFGTGTTTTNTTAGGVTTDSGVYLETTTALGLEDVSVPAGEFSNCLKMTTERTSSTFSAFKRVAWLCKDVGEVKRIQYNLDNTIRVWQLQSYDNGQ